jgi:hypothetical protein
MWYHLYPSTSQKSEAGFFGQNRYLHTKFWKTQGFCAKSVMCMSTLTVDDELYQRAAEAAATQGKTVDEFVGEVLRQALSMVGIRCTVRNGLPVMIVSDDIPLTDPAKVRQCLEEEGF